MHSSTNPLAIRARCGAAATVADRSISPSLRACGSQWFALCTDGSRADHPLTPAAAGARRTRERAASSPPRVQQCQRREQSSMTSRVTAVIESAGSGSATDRTTGRRFVHVQGPTSIGGVPAVRDDRHPRSAPATAGAASGHERFPYARACAPMIADDFRCIADCPGGLDAQSKAFLSTPDTPC